MDIRKFQAMAKLDMDETEYQWVSGRIDSLLKDFSILESIDTAATEPLITVLDIRNILREDMAKKSISREEILSGAPDQYDGYFRLPKALD